MKGVSDDRALWIARHVLPHEPALRAQIVRWRLPPGLDCDDIVQEAYGKIAAMDSVEHIGNPRGYLMMIARNAIVTYVRRARVVSIRAVDDLDRLGIAADTPAPDIQVSDREQLQLLAVAVAELPEPGRTAFLLRMMDELTHRVIGERLGMSENAVQKSVAKSLSILMAKLGRGGSAPFDASSGRGSSDLDERDGEARDKRRD